jgi:GT2 family glycosyltransferase
VIIPVYNAADYVRSLVASLEKSGPTIEKGLSFIFADDGSDDPGLRAVWKLPFFVRPDVLLLHNERNLGFVVNVNRLVAEAGPLSDIVILNSDTEIFANLFATLQEEAYSAHRIASVTPLTNNGTIASLFGFPAGKGLPPSLSPESVANVVHALNLPSPQVWSPTGVGFCLYLRREAISKFGLFDCIYGKGYGEESDWCQRARAHRWRNLISTRSFVYHAGTKSFARSEKAAAIKRNTNLLISRYPRYLDDVGAYCARDPLRFHRLRILLEILKVQSDGEMLLFALHSDPDLHTAGTEKHVLRLRQIASEVRKATIEIFPQGQEFRVRGHYRGHRYFDETFGQSAVKSLFALLSETIAVLHANHFLGWSDSAINCLVAAPFRKKIVTLHDFLFLCPSINLLSGAKGDRFCEVEADLVACNCCLKNFIRYEAGSIEEYRDKSFRRLAAFDRIIVPSRAVLPYWKKALAQPDLVERLEVLEHDLAPVVALSKRSMPFMEKEPRPLIAFVGAFHKYKGSELIAESIPRLRMAGFDVAVVGRLFAESDAKLAKLSVTHYKTLADLSQWLELNRPMIVAHPSLTAESFCYTFYECLLLSESAIPVVGCFGNPAEQIRETGAGVVMQEMTVDGLVSACERAREERARLAVNREWYRQTLCAGAPTYAEDYFRLVGQIPMKALIKEIKSLDFEELEATDSSAREAG